MKNNLSIIAENGLKYEPSFYYKHFHKNTGSTEPAPTLKSVFGKENVTATDYARFAQIVGNMTKANGDPYMHDSVSQLSGSLNKIIYQYTDKRVRLFENDQYNLLKIFWSIQFL